MAQLVKCLLHKHEDLSSDHLEPMEKTRHEGTCL